MDIYLRHFDIDSCQHPQQYDANMMLSSSQTCNFTATMSCDFQNYMSPRLSLPTIRGVTFEMSFMLIWSLYEFYDSPRVPPRSVSVTPSHTLSANVVASALSTTKRRPALLAATLLPRSVPVSDKWIYVELNSKRWESNQVECSQLVCQGQA
jgi:hypothetical protein